MFVFFVLLVAFIYLGFVWKMSRIGGTSIQLGHGRGTVAKKYVGTIAVVDKHILFTG